MKRSFTLILALLMLFSLTSCISKTAPETHEPPIPDEVLDMLFEEESEEINAAVFWYDYSDAFLSTVRDALNTELIKLGVSYSNYDAENTQSLQNYQIDEAIENGTDLLIVNIVEMSIDTTQAIVDKAKAANIPIIFFNREVDDEVINSYENACFVGTRAAEVSEKQGTMAGEYIVENYDAVDINGDGCISYIMMKGQLGCAELEVRSEYAVEFCNKELTTAGKPELVYYDPNNSDKFQLTNWKKDEAFNQMTTALSTNPIDSDAPIELVICNNDDAAMGCIEALNAVGYNTCDSKKFIPVFGVDYTAEAAKAIAAGRMTGSILLSATGMAETIAVLTENVMNGENVFDDAVDIFHVDEDVAKIRVPYEIKM